MDRLQRRRSHTISDNDQRSTKGTLKRRDSESKETNRAIRTSLPPGSSIPGSTPTGKSWMKFFGSHQAKQVSSETVNYSSGVDITYITPRLIVMTTVRENISDGSSPSTAELIENFFDKKHENCYTIYTLDQSSNEQLSHRKELSHKRVVDLPLFNDKQSPRLVVLLWFCQKISSYLLESPSNIAVLHCIDQRNQLAFGACSLLAYHRIFPQVDQILQYYQSKRCAHISFTMSQKRYIQYLCDLSFDVIERPHFNPLIIQAIHLTPVPLVNRQKTGCRPFVDIYDEEHKKIFSTHEETAKLKVYSSADSHCLIPINLPFNGDLTLHIMHAAIGHSRQTHEGGIRICELTINSNFSTINQPDLSYSRNELDAIDLNDKNPTLFRVKIEIRNLPEETPEKQDLFTEQLNKTLKQPLTLFADEHQVQQAISDNDQPWQQDNHDADESFFSSVIHRNRKSKDESLSPISTSPASLPTNFTRTSSAFPTQPIPSFVNPRHSLQPLQAEMDEQFLSQMLSSTSLIEEDSNEDKTTDVPLLDLEDDYFNGETIFRMSFSSDKPREELNPSSHSQRNLLDDDLDFDMATSLNDSASIITPTTIPIQEQNSSTSTAQSNTPTFTPNYSIHLPANNSTCGQPQSNSSRSNLATSFAEKPKIDIYQYFVGVGELGNKPRRQSEPPIPNTIGAARKAVFAKDVDPIVLKVREWTEGKKGNIRALLCSLSNITWPECKWSGCQMHELLTDEQVKKVYRKAVLHIHPDRLRDDPNEPLANLIFIELNEAWAQFENRN